MKIKAPKFVRSQSWQGYDNPLWEKKDKDKVTVLYNFVERRKSYFLQAYFERSGYRYCDLGDHVAEDVRFGKEYGNRAQCNPMYFTSGALIKALLKLEAEGRSKQEVVRDFLFIGGGGQCGPCRYGMYPAEYAKAVNEAGFRGFRYQIFSSDIAVSAPKGGALPINLWFRINMLVAIILGDLFHVAECALRPVALDRDELMAALGEGEKIVLEAFKSPWFFFTLPGALRRVNKILRTIKRIEESKAKQMPLVLVTGEFFANLAHNDGNYNLRRFIMDEGCRALPGLFTQRVLYDNWRRTQEARAGVKYAEDSAEAARHKKVLRKQRTSNAFIRFFWNQYKKALDPESLGGYAEILDLDHLAELGRPYYHPEIFGGEGNLEIAEALHYAGKVQGFISSKPFGCMPSSGVSDGVMTRIMAEHPELNFLSIETSGDNEVSILSRVSMLLFKAKKMMSGEGQDDVAEDVIMPALIQSGPVAQSVRAVDS